MFTDHSHYTTATSLDAVHKESGIGCVKMGIVWRKKEKKGRNIRKKERNEKKERKERKKEKKERTKTKERKIRRTES